jgi:hypothetical protein
MQGDLEHVTSLAREYEAQERLVEELETLLRAAKSRMSHIETVEIPMALEDLGIQKLALENGKTVKVDTIFTARINKGDEAAAFEWLEQHGEGDLITSRTVRNVHPNTLNAWLRRKYAAGQGGEIPDEYFHTFVGSKAVIK